MSFDKERERGLEYEVKKETKLDASDKAVCCVHGDPATVRVKVGAVETAWGTDYDVCADAEENILDIHVEHERRARVPHS